MVSCGTSSTGSKDNDLGVLDLLLRQDNFGDADSDGISDDFGAEYPEDAEKPPHSHFPDGTCYGDVVDPEQQAKDVEEYKFPEKDVPEGDKPENILYGCTDPSATNYNPDATTDDGSCLYEPLEPPIPDPDLPPPEPFRSKADALALSKQRKSRLVYPETRADQTNMSKSDWADKLYYYNIPNNGDGSDGYMRWKPGINKMGTKFWFPEPRPLHIALKYWRTGGFKNNDPIQHAQSATNGNYEVAKDGMYTEGLCSSIKYLSIYITGIDDEGSKTRDPLGHAGGKFCKAPYVNDEGETVNPWSTPPYHWLFRGDGQCSQLLCDHRAGIGASGVNKNNGDKIHNFSVSVNWMSYGARDSTYVKGNDCKPPRRTAGTPENFRKYRAHFPSDEQIIGMAKLIAVYIKRYPDIQVFGHNQQSTKRSCPIMWVPSWIRAGGIPGLDQAGIDKLILKGGNTKASSEAPDDYSIEPYLVDKYGPDTIFGEAARQLAKISNPAGIGRGTIPQPPGTTSGAPINQNQPIVRRWQDMECDEFNVWFNQNIKNNSNLTGFIQGLSDEDRDLLDEKTRDCSV